MRVSTSLLLFVGMFAVVLGIIGCSGRPQLWRHREAISETPSNIVVSYVPPSEVAAKRRREATELAATTHQPSMIGAPGDAMTMPASTHVLPANGPPGVALPPPADQGVNMSTVSLQAGTAEFPAEKTSSTRAKNLPASFSNHAPSPLPPPSEFVGPPPKKIELDLASALAMTDQQNPQVAYARERIHEAYAQLQKANVLWLPSLRAGVNYNKHEGQIQDVAGNVFTTSRGAFYSGLGAGGVGAGSPAVPGIYANFHTSDAYFQPRIVQNVVAARQAASNANTNDMLLQTALAYLELLQANQERSIALESVDNTRRLTSLTNAYANSGQGLRADDDRAQTELAFRENELARSDERVQTSSARLSQQLHIDASIIVVPLEPVVLPLQLTPSHVRPEELVASALEVRPEVAENRALVNEAIFRLRREEFAPLIPSLLLGVSYGGFGGGKGSNVDNYADRLDGDAIAYWELRNFGLGERAARSEASSRVEQARLRQVAMMDRIAREVVESHAQIQSRTRQIAISERGIKLASSSMERNFERIRNSEGLPLEVLQSIQALAAARREYLRSVIDYNTAQFQLLRSLGGSPSEYVPASVAQ